MKCWQVTYKEIEEMIQTVDRNGDGRISYSEFRSEFLSYRHHCVKCRVVDPDSMTLWIRMHGQEK
jgi:hypothetical protein